MVKVRAKLGDLNLTETIDSDSPPWGASNLKKLGKVILGFTKNELKTFPIRGIEDSVEVMGKQSGWRRGQVPYFRLCGIIVVNSPALCWRFQHFKLFSSRAPELNNENAVKVADLPIASTD